MRGYRTLAAVSVCCALAVAPAGCSRSQPGAPTPAAPAADAPAGISKLPVSLNEVMVALVNESADPIWIAAARPPESDEHWRAVERAAYQIELAGALLAIPGTGARDAEWTANPQWQSFTTALTQAGKQSVAAAEARDIQAVSKAGDVLVEVCEGCHKAFKPDIPTQKKYGELRYPLETGEPSK